MIDADNLGIRDEPNYGNGGADWFETRAFLMPGAVFRGGSRTRNEHPAPFAYPLHGNEIYSSHPENLIRFLERMI